MLNEQEMALARELARKLTLDGSIEKEEQVLSDIERFISIVKNVWQGVVETVRNFVQSLGELQAKNRKPKWDVPLKINPPPMPDIEFPKMQLARSNL